MVKFFLLSSLRGHALVTFKHQKTYTGCFWRSLPNFVGTLIMTQSLLIKERFISVGPIQKVLSNNSL
jgi:hypothetical protein